VRGCITGPYPPSSDEKWKLSFVFFASSCPPFRYPDSIRFQGFPPFVPFRFFFSKYSYSVFPSFYVFLAANKTVHYARRKKLRFPLSPPDFAFDFPPWWLTPPVLQVKRFHFFHLLFFFLYYRRFFFSPPSSEHARVLLSGRQMAISPFGTSQYACFVPQHPVEVPWGDSLYGKKFFPSSGFKSTSPPFSLT